MLTCACSHLPSRPAHRLTVPEHLLSCIIVPSLAENGARLEHVRPAPHRTVLSWAVLLPSGDKAPFPPLLPKRDQPTLPLRRTAGAHPVAEPPHATPAHSRAPPHSLLQPRG